MELELRNLLIEVHLFNPRGAVFQEELQRQGQRNREFSFFSFERNSFLILFAGACFPDHPCFASDVGGVFFATSAGFADDVCGFVTNCPGFVEDVRLIQGRRLRRAACHDLCHHVHEVIEIGLGQVQSSRRAFNPDPTACHLLDFSLQVLVGVFASLPVVAQILVEAGDLCFRAHHQRGAGVWDDATGRLHLWLLEGWVAGTHLEGLISNGDAMEIHGPVSLPHGGQRLRMMSSVHAQDTVCPVIEANGEIPHFGTVEKTWNFHPFGLPGAWLELSIGPAHAQNSLEVRSDLQAVIVHQKQTVLHVGIDVANADLVGSNLSTDLTATEIHCHSGWGRSLLLAAIVLFLEEWHLEGLGFLGLHEAGLAPLRQTLGANAILHNAIVASRVGHQLEALRRVPNRYLDG